MTSIEVMTTFEDLGNTSAYDIARTLASISRSGTSIPAKFVAYAKKAMCAFQEFAASELDEVQVTGETAARMKGALQVCATAIDNRLYYYIIYLRVGA